MNGIGTDGRVVCAPDKFRGALTSSAAAGAMAAGALRAGIRADPIAIADGGEGTLDVFVGLGKAEAVEVEARNAEGVLTRASIGDLGDGHFLIEASSVLAADPSVTSNRSPLGLSSAGAGDLMLRCIERGARQIDVAIGGVATIDGGIGILGALGADVPGVTASALFEHSQLDISPARELVRNVTLRFLYDVDCPLCGPDGTAFMFGVQKGLSRDSLSELDAAFQRYGAALGSGHASRAGAGAAGGIGVALYALGAEGVRGADLILDVVGFRQKLVGARLCLTGEGKLDRTTVRGKAVSAVVATCQAVGVPCAVIAGVVYRDGEELIRRAGASSVRALGVLERDLDEALICAAEEVEDAAYRECRVVHEMRRFSNV